MSKAVSITETLIESKIYLVRGEKIMLVPIAIGIDLAEMYGVETSCKT